MSKKQNRSHETLAKPIGLTHKKRERDPPAVPVGADQGGVSARRVTGAATRRGSSRSSTGGHLGTSTSSSSSSSSSRARRAQDTRASSRSTPSLHLTSASAAPPLRSYRSLSRLDQGPASDETPSAWAMPNPRAKCGPLSSQKSSTIPGAHVSKNSRTNGAHSSDVPRAEGVNHRKGWLMRQDSDGQWQRHWFVLAHQILRFYQDCSAEEAADADGEVNLSTCYDITEHPAQKSYGFQIHTKDGVYTLCAMTFGSRQNWVRAVLTNVQPDLTQEVKSVTPRSSGRSAHSLDPAGDTEDSKHVADDGCRQTRHASCDPPMASNQQPQERHAPGQHTEQGPAGGAAPLREPASSTVPSSSSSSSSRGPLATSSSPVPRGLPHVEEEEEPEEEEARCNRRPLPISPTLTGDRMTTQCSGGAHPFSAAGRSPASEGDRLEPPQSQADGAEAGPEEPPAPAASVGCTPVSGPSPEEEAAELNTGVLLKELEQTQRELAQLQQLNKNLQGQLEQERQCLSAGDSQNGASNSPLQATAFHRLQRMNQDLGSELAAQRRSQEEAKEAELRRRAELCAGHSQLLVTGHAGDPPCVQLEEDHRRFRERQEEWERQVASLQSQLQHSEGQREEVERSLLELQRDNQGHQGAREEAGRLRERLQEVMVHLRANEEAQAQKECRLQEHLLLLQESQDRERRRLASSLDRAESRSLDLKERLERAEQQVQNKGPSWTREITDAQQQLQDELACTVAAVKKLQGEREQLRCHCQDLETQLGEVDAEVGRLRDRLKTEETDYYNLEHSYERVSEDLQLALGKVDQRGAELQDIREGYERLLDRKEQELSEVLVKMEILGNSLEETEVKLSEVLKACTCSSEPDQSVKSVKYDPRQKDEDPLGMSNNCPKIRSNSLTSTSSIGLDFPQQDTSPSNEEHARARSRSIDPSFQYFVTNGEDQDRFMDVIQVLETKLYVTEEKLRDITQRLGDHQSHMICQDPLLCSQLTQSKANAQHLGLLLHKQAKQNQRFAQQTESRSRLLVITFQAALTALEVARRTLLSLHQNLKDGHNKIDATELEKQLAAVVACLQQGERNAEEQQQESYYSIREESRMSRDDMSTGEGVHVIRASASEEIAGGNTGRLLKKEAQLVEKMLLALQNREGIARLQLEQSTHIGDVVQRLKCLTSQKIDLKNEINSSKSLEGAIGRVCAEAEIIYTAFMLQWQYQMCWQDQEKCHDPAAKTSLADICPSEKVDPEEDASKSINKDMEYKEQRVLARLVNQLQRRANTLHKLCQEICDTEAGNESSVDQNELNHSTMGGQGMREQAMLIYIFDRLSLDFNLELQRCKEEHDRLKALCQGHELVLMEERQRSSQDLSKLHQENTTLREQLEDIGRKRTVAEAGNQQLLESIRTIETHHRERIQKLEEGFQKKIKELQDIHEEEMKQLVVYFSKSASVSDSSTSPSDVSESNESMGTTGQEEQLSLGKIKGQKDELDSESQTTREGLGFHMCDSDQTSTMRKAYQADFEKLKDSCDQGISAMEEMYRQLVEDLKQQHQSEVADLLREKDKLLKEESAATMAAIVAMKRAHKAELEKSQRSQNVLESGDIAQLQAEHEEEIRALREELEVLSVQHTHRCVQNSEMSQQLERERRALAQCQEQIQDLRSKEGTGQRASQDQTAFGLAGDLTHLGSVPTSRDLQEMEASLRVQDTELQSLRPEAQRPREQLKTALRDKAQLQSPTQWSIPWFRSNPIAATRKPPGGQGPASDDIIVAKSDSAFRRKKSFTQHIRERSKSLKEGLSVQERRKLFES